MLSVAMLYSTACTVSHAPAAKCEHTMHTVVSNTLKRAATAPLFPSRPAKPVATLDV